MTSANPSEALGVVQTGSWRLGSTPTSRGVGPSACSLHHPADATMAALSVHMARLGSTARRPRCSHSLAVRFRNRALAATPPPKQSDSAPDSWAARTALATSTSTTAAWKEAATSGVLTSGFLRTGLITAVFSPLQEKS